MTIPADSANRRMGSAPTRRAVLGYGVGLSLAAMLPGCGREAQDGRFKIVTTFTIIADMARNVAGDAAMVES
ncbi:MAG: hypothetical protein MK010_11685, partial [Erythrobacter sp.]|nr:hypothetical protein [Erythrobacter sp.]